MEQYGQKVVDYQQATQIAQPAEVSLNTVWRCNVCHASSVECVVLCVVGV